MKYYANGSARTLPGIHHHIGRDIEAADPESAAAAFIALYPKLYEVWVFTDFNSMTARNPSIKPLFTWQAKAKDRP
jgi:hypothetical protein